MFKINYVINISLTGDPDNLTKELRRPLLKILDELYAKGSKLSITYHDSSSDNLTVEEA